MALSPAGAYIRFSRRALAAPSRNWSTPIACTLAATTVAGGLVGAAAAGAAAASLLVAGAAAGTGADGSFLEQAASATVNSRQAPSRERAGMFLHSIGDSPLHDPWYRRAARPLARAIPP